ncbi:hypothetical protein [Methylomonas sp. AM2-LC]|uniref:hypothetical protein n=1 Tax=Methylomonas sp. AM2-LC TaxID=3153301 RepID=UPI0032677BB1
MKGKQIRQACGLGLMLVLPYSASAASITNGSFSAGVGHLDGWSAITSDAGTINAPGDGTVILATGDGTTSAIPAVLEQGDDGSFSFTNPLVITPNDLSLSFNAVFSESLISGASASNPAGEVFNVYLYDANSPASYLLTSIDASTAVTHFLFDLTAYQGLSVALSFELNHNNDGYTSQVALSNVDIAQQTSAVVPEVETSLLFLVGLGNVIGFSRKVNRKKNNS